MSSIPLLVLFFVAAYFLLLRPQQQRVRRQRDLITGIGVGDNVVTAGGIVGHVVDVSDDRMQLEVADGVVMEFLRLSVSRRLSESEAPSWAVGTDEDVDDDEEPAELGEGELGEGEFGEAEYEDTEESADADLEADGEPADAPASVDDGVAANGTAGSGGSIEEGAVPAPRQDPH